MHFRRRVMEFCPYAIRETAFPARHLFFSPAFEHFFQRPGHCLHFTQIKSENVLLNPFCMADLMLLTSLKNVLQRTYFCLWKSLHGQCVRHLSQTTACLSVPSHFICRWRHGFSWCSGIGAVQALSPLKGSTMRFFHWLVCLEPIGVLGFLLLFIIKTDF